MNGTSVTTIAPARFTLGNDTVKNVLAVMVPLTFIGHLGMWSFFPPENLSDKVIGMLQAMLGLHGGWAGMIIGYYFNSSASSARQQEIIAASPPPTVQPPGTVTTTVTPPTPPAVGPTVEVTPSPAPPPGPKVP